MFLQCLANGILIAGLYALVTLGLTMVLGIMGIVNFAHGDFVMLGAYITYWAFTLISIDPLLSSLLSAVLVGVLGIIIYKFNIKPILNAESFEQVLLTFGISIILQNIALILWKADFRSITTSYSGISIHIENVSIGLARLLTFLLAFMLTILLSFFNKTPIGKAMRAVSQNRKAAQLMGIDIDKTYMIAFAIASALGGLAGGLSSLIMYVYPYEGVELGLKAFAILILGGLGNIWGTLIASLILGITESFVSTYLPYGSSLASGLSFLIIIIVLMIKPTGLAGTRRE
jgi:branched-chain amino acid transport system permease protein